MGKILLNDCSEETARKLSKLLGSGADIVSGPFRKNRDISEFDMVALYAEEMTSGIFEKMKHLQFSTKFRSIPIVFLQPGKPSMTPPPRFCLNAMNILSLSDPPGALRQGFQRYMPPIRKAGNAEMEWVSPFISGTQDVFSTMASMDVAFKQVYFQDAHRRLGDISGVIDLSGEAEGIVVLTFYWELARQVISRTMGGTPDEIGPELLNDGVGEIISMIAGSAKRRFTGSPFSFQLSLPTVILGWQHEIGRPENSTVAVLLFDVEDMAFTVQVSLIPGKR